MAFWWSSKVDITIRITDNLAIGNRFIACKRPPFNMRSTLIFAHRGALLEAAENTRTAFAKALAYPIDGIETDIQLSRDEVPVLWHDEHLGKIGRPQQSVADLDYLELCRIELKDWLPNAGPGESLLSLDALLRDFPPRRHWLLEIKLNHRQSAQRQCILIRRCLELVAPYRAEAHLQRIRFSSFDLDSLIYAQQCSPDWHYVYNATNIHTAKKVEELLTLQPFLAGLCIPINILNPELASAVCERNRLLATYTCNTDEEIRKALDLGVDVLISDDPSKALKIREDFTI